MKIIDAFLFITHEHPQLSPSDQVLKALQAGFRWIQLRMKNADDFLWEKEAVESMEHCEKYGGILIINDNIEVAYRVMAHGVHLGKEDISPKKARAMMGPDAIIGRTCNTEADVLECNDLDINYIGLGPYKPTKTKKNLAPTLGIPGFSIAQLSHFPVIGIGGIEMDDVAQLRKDTSLDGIAFSSLLLQSENWEKTFDQLKQLWHE